MAAHNYRNILDISSRVVMIHDGVMREKYHLSTISGNGIIYLKDVSADNCLGFFFNGCRIWMRTL